MSLLLVYAGDVTLRESKAQLANTQIVFETVIGVLPNWEIYVINADGTNHVRLTHHSSLDRWPCWSPDGTKIAFASTRDGDSDIYMMNSDGTGVVNLTNHPRSPDSMGLIRSISLFICSPTVCRVGHRMEQKLLLNRGGISTNLKSM
jgi:dipeptidyl aminopeptidase/acylaminoacyl peptidase